MFIGIFPPTTTGAYYIYNRPVFFCLLWVGCGENGMSGPCTGTCGGCTRCFVRDQHLPAVLLQFKVVEVHGEELLPNV